MQGFFGLMLVPVAMVAGIVRFLIHDDLIPDRLH